MPMTQRSTGNYPADGWHPRCSVQGMKIPTPQPPNPPKQRPIRFVTVEAFAAAYMELHSQAPASSPDKSSE